MKYLRYFIGGLAILAIAGCDPSDKKILDYGKDEVAQSLKDPTSAMFRNVYFKKDEKQLKSGTSGYVCGELNAKNSFGAYVGYGPFYIHVYLEPRWVLPAFGVLKGSSDLQVLSGAGSKDEQLAELLKYNEICGQH